MRTIWFVALLAALMFTAGCASQPSPKETTAPIPTTTSAPTTAPAPVPAGVPSVNPFKGDAAAIVAGKTIYDVNCMACHGADGKGMGLPNQPDFTSAAWWAAEEDSDLFMAVTNGVGTAMPPWKDLLTEDERWKALAYEHSLSQK